MSVVGVSSGSTNVVPTDESEVMGYVGDDGERQALGILLSEQESYMHQVRSVVESCVEASNDYGMKLRLRSMLKKLGRVQRSLRSCKECIEFPMLSAEMDSMARSVKDISKVLSMYSSALAAADGSADGSGVLDSGDLVLSHTNGTRYNVELIQLQNTRTSKLMLVVQLVKVWK